MVDVLTIKCQSVDLSKKVIPKVLFKCEKSKKLFQNFEVRKSSSGRSTTSLATPNYSADHNTTQITPPAAARPNYSASCVLELLRQLSARITPPAVARPNHSAGAVGLHRLLL